MNVDLKAATQCLAKAGVDEPAREARLLASIEHPNIVSVYGAGRAGPRPSCACAAALPN